MRLFAFRGLQVSSATSHSGGMATVRHPPPRHVRNIVELYLRAYWRYYVAAGVWAAGATIVVPAIQR